MKSKAIFVCEEYLIIIFYVLSIVFLLKIINAVNFMIKSSVMAVHN